MPSHNDAVTLQSLHAGMDHAAKTMERKWGVERLPLLVNADLRAKFERQRIKTNEALETAWGMSPLTRMGLERAQMACEAMERAWAALDKEAEKNGSTGICGACTILETAGHHGRVIAIVQTNAEAAHVMADGRAVDVYTLDEIANVIAALPEVVSAAKRTFPGAKVQPPKRDRSWIKDGDPIPF